MKKIFGWIVVLFYVLGSTGIFAQTVSSRFVSVSLFKNGLGFVTSEVEISEETENVLIEQLPVPVHGTFWLYPISKGLSIKDAKAFEKEIIESVPAITIAEILEANAGNTVTLQLSPERSVTGKIISVPENRKQSMPAQQYRSSYYTPSVEAASLVVFQTEEGVLFLNKNLIQQVSVASKNFKTEIERKKPGSALEIEAAGKGKIGFQYLTKGITWAPSCSVDITDPKKARILTKAEIINEIGDLEGVTVNFISGFPNFQFSEVVSPIARQGDLAAFLNNLANPPGRPRADVMQQRAVMYNAPVGETFAGYVARPEGQTMEELFLYEKKNISLKKGERGYYPLYDIEVPYEHIYEWKIGDVLDEQERYQRDDRAPKTEEVWHSLRLTNTGKIPWTTAPAITTQNGQILGQDTLYYTSPGAKTNLRITQAVDIKAEQAEFEVNRKRNAANFYGSSYDLVDVKGVLDATNYKNREVTLTITKMLSGEVTSVSPDAKIEKIAKGLKKVNPRCKLTWEIPIKAGEKIQIEYQYQVYVRN
jgi:hypothetical protein